ncbi:hypothetical protein [Deinococcus sp. QL22]|uniref:hypothetical protein n=1 Tax=Deinococcus sp. QL22 TaxID=2939437 RepID=UPI00201736C1|nr:hypothetical protein [Deinococcus sp. QL22]UQN04845.1 hypothetical protein M1R55_07885 [Deinococcus sp. QL22]UQN08611.1 hypothetical protein M1R55_21010 [Deinococcus sp. QL22]
MTLLEEFNARWEMSLTGLTAEVWQKMKALGVTAHWIDPLNRDPRLLQQQMSLMGWNVQASEFYTFAVYHNDEILVEYRRYSTDEAAVVVTALSDAATQLEMYGLQVIPSLNS